MSHITQIKTQYRDLVSLHYAIESLGFHLKVGEDSNLCKYWGRQYQPADVVYQQNTPTSNQNFEIGFSLQEDGSYALIADEYALSNMHYKCLDKPTLDFEYSFQVAKKTLTAHGFEVSKRVCDKPTVNKEDHTKVDVIKDACKYIEGYRFIDGHENRVRVYTDDKGNIGVETEGFSGQKCYDVTSELESKLGKSISNIPTAESFEREPEQKILSDFDTFGLCG